MVITHSPPGGCESSQENPSWGAPHPDPSHWLAAIAASECRSHAVTASVGRCRSLQRLVFGVMSKSSMPNQDVLGQEPPRKGLLVRSLAQAIWRRIDGHGSPGFCRRGGLPGHGGPGIAHEHAHPTLAFPVGLKGLSLLVMLLPWLILLLCILRENLL